MSRTITIPWWLCPSSSQMALLMISRGVCWYPLVRNSSALAYRAGESSSPGRSGSSPMHSRTVRMAPHIFSRRSASASGSGVFAWPAKEPDSQRRLPYNRSSGFGGDKPDRAKEWDMSSRCILGRLDAAAAAAASSSSAAVADLSPLAVVFAAPLVFAVPLASFLPFLLPLFLLRFLEAPPFALPATLVESSASVEIRLGCSFCSFCSFCAFAAAGAGTAEDAAGAMSRLFDWSCGVAGGNSWAVSLKKMSLSLAGPVNRVITQYVAKLYTSKRASEVWRKE